MPIAFRTFSTAATSVSGTSLDITLPATAQIGDFCLVTFQIQANVTWNTTPSGWTKLGEGSDASYDSVVFWRFLTSGDPGSTLTFGSGTSGQMAAMALCYIGVATGTPIAASEWGARASANESPFPSPSITTAGTRWLVGLFGARQDATTWTPEAGFTTRAAIESSGTNPASAFSEDSDGDRAAGTYTASVTPNSAFNNGVAWIIALTPLTTTTVAAGAAAIGIVSNSPSVVVSARPSAGAVVGSSPAASSNVGPRPSAGTIGTGAYDATVATTDQTVPAQAGSFTVAAVDPTINAFSPPQYYSGYLAGYETLSSAVTAYADRALAVTSAQDGSTAVSVTSTGSAPGTVLGVTPSVVSAQDEHYGTGYTGGYPPYVLTAQVSAGAATTSMSALDVTVITDLVAGQAASTVITLEPAAVGSATTTSAAIAVTIQNAAAAETITATNAVAAIGALGSTSNVATTPTEAGPSLTAPNAAPTIAANVGSAAASLSAQDEHYGTGYTGGYLPYVLEASQPTVVVTTMADTATSIVIGFSTQQSQDVPIAVDAATISVSTLGILFAAPLNLTATVISPWQIDLSWSPVAWSTGYDIERDGVVVVMDWIDTNWSDTGLASGSTHSYRVRAVA